MFRSILKLFQPQALPREPFVDDILREFHFDRDLGWKKKVTLGGVEAEIILGSDGDLPTGEMIETARMWVAEWPSRQTEILVYLRSQLGKWADAPDVSKAEELQVESVNILWPNKPKMSMIYFKDPKGEGRAWHVTYDAFEPKGLGCDD